MKPTKYRLGLDVGTNSLGWGVLELDNEGNPCAIVAAGSRIFAEGRDSSSKATLAATRRDKRSARRRRDRFKQRQRFLLSELTKAGLFPEAEAKAERQQLQQLNPLALRAQALTERLECWEVGRALFHINQRRGFKSNRKDQSKETTSVGVVSRSVRLLLEQMGLIELKMPREQYRTLSSSEKKRTRQREAQARKEALVKLASQKELSYGTFLYQRQSQHKPTRARPQTAGDGKLYDVYPTRELYEDEFNKIWEAQSAHYPEQMTEAARKQIHRAIFHQRPLKPQKRGKCAYMPKEDRTFRAMPSFQRYRIYQEVNSLEWWDGRGNNKVRDHRDARDAIVALLENVTTKSGKVTFGSMKKELKRREVAEGNFKFNFETQKRKGFDGNLTSNLMQHEDRIGADWHNWSLEKQDEFIDIILNGTPCQQERDRKRLEGGSSLPPPDGARDDEEIRDYLMEHFGLQQEVADSCLNAHLKDDTASVSCRAARLMLNPMREGLIRPETGEIFLPLQSEAASAVAREEPNFVDPFRSRGDDGKYQLLNRLPYYGEAFRDGRHVIPGTGNPEHDDKTRWGGVTNPTVHIALNQIRLVVNELIKRFGHPHSIAIELGRELPAGADRRKEIEREQQKNQARNEKFDERLGKLGQKTNRENRLRLFLWEELSEDPNGRCCPFSGAKIGICDLFDGSTEIEHLLPFSRSLDDSRANRVICIRKANRDKGNRTPFEAFGDSPPGYEWDQILARTESLPSSKRWRFQPDALQIWLQAEGSDFTSRHLNDTRYIGRLTREYLETICHIDKIDVVTGRLTSLLRHHWGLNTVLNHGGRSGRKNRDDNRHHAVDAIVVGMTSRSLLQKVATEARKLESMEQSSGMNISRLFPTVDGRKSAIDPWNGFRDEVASVVQKIAVSHKARRKNDGQLHNDTAYGIVQGPDQGGNYEVVSREPITYFNTLKRIESIRDWQLRKEFRTAFEREENKEAGKGSKAVLALARNRNIRSLRRTENLNVIPITDAAGRPYKAYKGDSNWGIEIFSYPAKHSKADNWEGIVVSRFKANSKEFKRGETCRPHPAARLVMRLQINDCVEMRASEGSEERKLYRLPRGRMTLVEIHEGNVDKRHRSEEDEFKYTSAGARKMKSHGARKVHISSTGLVNYEQRRVPRRR